MTIKNKLTLTIVSIVLIVISILGYIYLSSMHASLYAMAHEKTAEKATESANVIAQLLDVRLNAVNALAEFLGDDADQNGLKKKIANIEYTQQISDFEYYAILWYGKWYYVSGLTFTNIQPVVGYAGMPGRAVFGRLYKNEKEGLLLQQYIFDGKGNEIGRLVAKLSADKFWDDITSTTDILSSEGIIVSRHFGDILYPSKYAGGRLHGSQFGKIGEADIRLDDTIIHSTCLSMPIVNAQMDVTALLNDEDLNRNYGHIVLLFFIVVGSALILIGALVYLVSSRMTRSISELSEYVAQMGADCDSMPDKFIKRSDEAGKLANSFSLLLTRLKASMDETDYIARHDSLTLLSNRYCLESDITAQIRKQQTFAFALLDVDDFKVINDSKGHDEGDRLLKDLASVFRTFKPTELTAYRWGGDEFALIIYGKKTAQYEKILNQIMERIGTQFHDAGDSRITVSIGVCAYPEHAANYKDLLINADKALAWAKMSGKVNFCFYKQ